MRRIVAAGSILVDHINEIEAYPNAGELAQIRSVARAPGGLVPNTGRDIRSLAPDVPVAAFGMVGDDDALAVAVGTAHGVYKAKPKLRFDRISEIRAAMPAPLVLHGGSGLSDDDFRTAIACGIAKLNIHTDMVVAGMRAMREQCACHDAARPATWDYLDTRRAKVEAIKSVVARKLELFGSINKA